MMDLASPREVEVRPVSSYDTSTFHRWLDRLLSPLEVGVSIASIVAAVAFLTADIALRVTVNISLAWANEATRYAIVWMVFFGAGRAARDGAHITIDALQEVLPANAARVVARAGCFLSAAGCAVLGWYSAVLVHYMTQFRQLSPSLEIPLWIVYLALPIGFAIMTLRFLQAAIRLPVPGMHSGQAG